MSPSRVVAVALLLVTVASATPGKAKMPHALAASDSEAELAPHALTATDSESVAVYEGVQAEMDLTPVNAEAIKALMHQVKAIQSGEASATFSVGAAGDIFTDDPQDAREAVGGCLLDKSMALVEELAARDHTPEVQQDIAACCTHGSTLIQVQCIRDAAEGFHLVANAEEKCQHLIGLPWGPNCIDRIAGNAARLIIQAGQKRVKQSHLAAKSAFFIARCARKPGACMTKVMQKAYDEEPEELQKRRYAIEQNDKAKKQFEGIKEVPQGDSEYDAVPRERRMVESRYEKNEGGARIVEVYLPDQKN